MSSITDDELFEGVKYYRHFHPVWRERANYICNAVIEDDGGPPKREQLWARNLGGGRLELCCIPYFIYDLELGDVFSLTKDGLVDAVLERSGRFVFRVSLVGFSLNRDDLRREIEALGCLQEWMTMNWLSIDAENVEVANTTAAYLWDRMGRGELTYETGRRRADDVP